jgi:regulator of sigma E protease
MTSQIAQSVQFIIEFILILFALVCIHEFGHFIACKLLKIEVEEFGFGIPPRILTLFERGGTKYTLNLIPLGGFVRPKGENDPSIPGSFAAHHAWKRITVFLAGPAMNLLVAIVLFIIIYGVVGYLPDRNRVQLVDIAPNSPASEAGLLAGDILVNIGGTEIHSLDAVRAVIYANLGKTLDLTFERNGVSQEVTVTPLADPGDSGALGIYMSYPMMPYTLSAAIPEGFKSFYEYTRELFGMLGRIIQGQASPSEGRFVGIKGMSDMYTSVRESDATTGAPKIANVMVFIASISISLGLMNLLPIPALDGGRILFALPELVIHRRIPPKYEIVVNFVSFALLILLMIYINLQDFINPITSSLP